MLIQDISFSIDIDERSSTFLLYKYSRVLYRPLKPAALNCLQDFVSRVIAALQEFHKLTLDVRLPNLCINENFDLVFIDVDKKYHILVIA